MAVAVVEKWPLGEVRLYILGCFSFKSLVAMGRNYWAFTNEKSLKTYPEAG